MKTKICILLMLMLTVFISGCGQRNDLVSNTKTESEILENINVGTPKQEIVEVEYVSSTSTSSDDSTKIVLNKSGIKIDGDGVSVSGNIITISTAGTYVISGTLTDGQIIIDANKNDVIQLVMNGVTLSNSQSSPIWAKKASQVIITLSDGTENYITDGINYVYAEGEDEPSAAIFSKTDLLINGTGNLTVIGNYNNGIASKDDLIIASGNITVEAVSDAIRGKDCVIIYDGTINLASGNDGIQSNNIDDPEKGYVAIYGGTITINAGNDGIQAESSVMVNDGIINIKTGNVSGITVNGDSNSYKGIKCSGDILFTDGTFTIESQDDTIHANGNIIINGGTFTLTSGDDGIHADGDLYVNDGDITIPSCYEGLEASNIYVIGGTIYLNSSDDAINAAGGSDGSGGGGFGRDMFRSGGNYAINISGGTIYAIGKGDGFDSNGSITISGGEIVMLINSTPDNGAMDCDGAFTITGGIVIYGGTGTGHTDTSKQSYVYISNVPEGAEVSVRQNGNELTSFTAEIACSQLVITTPDVVTNSSYDIYINESKTTTVTAGTGARSGMGGWGGGRPNNGRR